MPVIECVGLIHPHFRTQGWCLTEGRGLADSQHPAVCHMLVTSNYGGGKTKTPISLASDLYVQQPMSCVDIHKKMSGLCSILSVAVVVVYWVFMHNFPE